MANSVGYHESEDKLRKETQDNHRALTSAMEELEAVDWYDQRVDASGDQELREILAHNRDEEKEHAAMLLEWLRRRDPVLDRMLRDYLFAEVPVTEREAQLDQPGSEGSGERLRAPGDGSLGIGSLKSEVRR